ncbi:MAG: ribosome-binding factor A [Candidatus Peregrinibacteria bacterium]
MSKRPQMLASVIRQAIAPILRECPPECGIVAITEVEVSPDFAYATLLINSSGDEKAALRFFEQHGKQLQRSLAGLETHHTPHLRFRIDPRGERGRRIDELLR